MTATPGGARRYEPFPSFAGWAATAGFDPSVVAGFEELLAQSRAAVTPEALAAAVRVASRSAAVDTGALEGLYQVDRGFTRTIAEETATWEEALQSWGEATKRLIEDNLNAYEFVLDAVTGNVEISESWLRQLHETICASGETFTVYTSLGPQTQALPKGEYKRMPNSPTSVSTGTTHHYAPVADTPAEMRRLMVELRTKEFQQAHPVVQASYAHYGFVCVHPFADGNGRVARALASVFLYRSPGVPLLIFADQRDQYLDALEAADAGRPEAFVGFVEQRAIDAIGLVRTHLEQAASAENTLERMRARTAGPAGVQHEAFDALAKRLRGLLREEFEGRWRELAAPDGITLHLRGGPRGTSRPPDGYRGTAGGTLGFAVTIQASDPVRAEISVDLGIWIAASQADLVAIMPGQGDPLTVLVRDIHPQESTVLRLKVNAWVQKRIELLLQRLDQELTRNMTAQGFGNPDGEGGSRD